MDPKTFVNRFFLVAAIAGAILAAYVVAKAETPGNSKTAQQTETSQVGAQIVAEGNARGAIACARCHGYDGASDGSGAFPALAGQSAVYLAHQLQHYAAGQRQNAIMGSIAKGLNEEEIDSVSQYYANATPPAILRTPTSPDLVALGKQFALVGDTTARVQNCVSCHGPNGQGLPPTIPYLAGQYRQYIKVQLQMFRKGYRTSASMQDVAHALPDQHVDAIAAYFDQLPLPSRK
jgi:cytochrome c553